MSGLVHLQDVVLEPVVEFVPLRFATQQHPHPKLSAADVPDEWEQYWLTSLADVGIVGLTPIRPGSWHVPTRRLMDVAVLEKFVRGLVASWEGVENLVGPDADPVLSGGFTLISMGKVVLEPMCCGDLGNLIDWRQAAEYRGADWRMLWIGHPWISVRFEQGLLILSELHEGETPVGQHTLGPDDLVKAIGIAAAELEDFSCRLRAAVEPIVGAEHAPSVGRQMAGLTSGDNAGIIQ